MASLAVSFALHDIIFAQLGYPIFVYITMDILFMLAAQGPSYFALLVLMVAAAKILTVTAGTFLDWNVCLVSPPAL